ncbi:methyltransferase domain-containing protein [Eubacterium coprostanoligenes]|uniref:methyltransferase domain-containing protein n=1 Tax=Eubacterium coprostanoligenes TaxID=290054 RepID=UPI002354C8D0|nr:methyltransferase domain-containing protein [Eubacterium coprostanoligenes]MCI6253877.1 methyltransferase domain-containing protein [Eubacterium coprostanoligenes]MCI7264312.1 methyltransferase domain-containing protein [Eubacterium coprostanoligenes]MDD7357849.1 methyltransferase domain-containing protein [Eubacterium coprostanoligenes]MDY5400963.1 methyltransferase domain-containing protein [Eubacterium coprostanoligenes]
MSKPTTLKEYNQTWYMKTKAGALYRKFSGQITTACDMVKDFKICGKSLTKYVASVDRKVLQATGSESARYWALDEVFKDMKFNKDDKFIDVGCGKGRILAEMERIKFPGQLYGIELNPDVAKYAQDWAKRYDNLTIMAGDAFKLDYNDYNIIMLCRPFLEEMYVTFLEKMEKDIKHPVTVILYVDNYMAKYVKDKPQWTMHKQEVVFKKGLLAYSYYPVRYSIWTYDPTK